MKSSTLRHSALAVLAALAAGAAFGADEPGTTESSYRYPSSSESKPDMTSEPQRGTMPRDTRQEASDMSTTRSDSSMGSQETPPAWLDQEARQRINGFFVYD